MIESSKSLEAKMRDHAERQWEGSPVQKMILKWADEVEILEQRVIDLEMGMRTAEYLIRIAIELQEEE